MRIIRWAAVAVNALLTLMNIGTLLPSDQKVAPLLLVAGAVLGIAGIVAVTGFVRRSTWGRPLLLGVAAVNLVTSLVALVADVDGAVIGIVVSALALVLGYLATGSTPATVRTSTRAAH